MANALNDGLSVPDNLEIPAGSVVNASLGANAVSGTKVSDEFGVMLTGSPAYGGLTLQYGTGTTSAGSIAWVTYGKAMTALPHFIVGPNGAAPVSVTGSPVGAGSTLVVSEGASVPFTWIAFGYGRV